MKPVKTRYSDLGTPERHKKAGGARLSTRDDAKDQVEVSSSLIDLFYTGKLISYDQKITADRLCFDFQVGILIHHPSVTINYDEGSGGVDSERYEKARKRYNQVVRILPDAVIISDLCLASIDGVGVYIRPISRICSILNSLEKIYCQIDKGQLQ